MKLTFYGGAGSVTGANYLLESQGHKILIDCGLTQGSRFCEKKNFEPFPYEASEIEAVIVTHAHIDHTGLLPKLYKEGFRGEVWSTPPTKDFAELLLLDSEDILKREAQRQKRKPIYDEDDIIGIMSEWRTIEYRQPLAVGPFHIELVDAGHILGSASIIINAEKKRIAFSGDLGNTTPTIIKTTDYIKDTDYALVESAYGSRLHEKVEKREEMMEDFIEEILRGGGTLLIPAFSMERTQQMLYEINNLVEKKRIPRVPIYIDSPLAIKLTTLYKKYKKYYREKIREQIKTGDDIFSFPGLETTLTHEESRQIEKRKGAKIIIAGSGMSHGGRILRHEKKYLPDAKNGILFVGYQGEESLGRKIQEKNESVIIEHKQVPVRAKIKTISGYSAHADQEGLVKWIRQMKDSVKEVFIVQGDQEAEEALAKKLREKLDVMVKIPENKETVEL